jgi:hypothetical protein
MDTAAAGSRVVCGNPECADRWLRRWKDRRRPIFECNWGCSARCMQAMVEVAVRREWAFVDAREAAAEEGQHRHRVPLGLVLLAQGWITHPQLRHALEVQRRAGSGKIGRWLVQEFGLKEACVTHALSLQWGCSVLPMDGFDPRAMALGVPRILVERLGVLPLKISGRRVLYLAFADEMDAAAAFAMERMSGLKVESGLVDEMQWKDARTRLLASEFVDATVERVANPHAVAQTMAAAVCKLQPKASRLVRVHQFYWMRMWLESGAMCSGTSDGDGGIPATSEDVLDTVCEVGIDQTDSGIRRSSR